MSTAETAPASPTTPGPGPASAETPSRMGRLLGLVRKLIDYGKELANTVHERIAADPIFARCAFGCSDLTLILARITRGLQLAGALEARLVCIEERAPAARPAIRVARAPRERAPRAVAPDAEPTGVPTPEQIAAWVRHRPIGAVIADICRDLGILPTNPLWQELTLAIIGNGGNLARLVEAMLDRAFPLGARAAPPTSAAQLAPTCTGPP